MISDAVNTLASRIESLTKSSMSSFLISEHTYGQGRKARDIRPIDVVVVKGKTRPVTIFEIFERDDPAERAAKRGTRDLLLAGVEALSRGDDAGGRDLFDRCP